jgi:endo-1,4-beta-xylanase
MMRSTQTHSHATSRTITVVGAIALLAVLFVCALHVSLRRQYDARSALEPQSIDAFQPGWSYLPGATTIASGLRITHLGRTIVQQDGTGGQDNPPVNLYGTHFRVLGDFEMKISARDIAGTASLQFYDSPPIIQDEFRVEPKSIRVSINGTTATVEQWNGYENQKLSAQNPSSSNDYMITSQPVNMVTLAYRKGHVSIAINNTIIASQPENGFFDSGMLWVGADASSDGDSWTLSSLQTSGHIATINTQDDAPITKQATGLQQLASSRRANFFIGTAVALGPLVADSKYAQLAFGGNFGQMTTENALKWQFIHPQRSVYDFHETDALVAMAQKNGLKVHGHTLIFGEANPPWVRDLPLATAADKLDVQHIMTDHITTTLRHYKGKISSWDVINEPIAEDDVTLRQHIWHQAMGEDYIKAALTAARSADPQAQLFINEYGLEQDGDRWDTFLALITRLKAQGVPIDGVGLQAHVYDIHEDAIDPLTLRSHIQALAKLGLVVRISEMDVDSSGGAELQARQYAEVLGACLAEPGCISWSTWGVSDAYNMWQDNNQRLQRGQDLLWDTHYQPTKAVSSLTRALGVE